MSTEGAPPLEPMDTSPCGDSAIPEVLQNGHGSSDILLNGDIKQEIPETNEQANNESHIKVESPDTIASSATLQSVVNQVTQLENGAKHETMNGPKAEVVSMDTDQANTPTPAVPLNGDVVPAPQVQTQQNTNVAPPTNPVIVNGVSNSSEPKDQTKEEMTLQAVMSFLKKHNLQETEKILKRETKVSSLADISVSMDRELDGDMAIYRSEGDPNAYDGIYESLRAFVDTSLDSYRHELSVILYPCFVHMYLELVYNNHQKQAAAFMQKFGSGQEEYLQDDIRQLSSVRRRDQMADSQLMQNFRTGQYTVRMCKDTFSALRRFLADKKNSSINNIVQENIYVDVYEGIARSRQQVEAVSGSLMGEASKQLNKVKVYHGLPKEPTIILEDEDDAAEDGDGKPKKKKSKKDSSVSKKTRADPNAPASNRIPLPELRDADKIDRANAMKDSLKKVRLGPGSLPSICFYNLLNSRNQASAVEINDEASMMAVGLQDSRIRVFSLTPAKLRAMRNLDLDNLDPYADDVLYRMMDDRCASESKILVGHQGPVTSLSFSPDNQYLLSGSEDGTVRLWSLLTWTNLVSYKGHIFAVWSVQFAPVGYYFVSCGHDRTARFWATESYQPLRVFAGHYSDVDCVQFHPNSNYVATGSTDRSVRLWDVSNGQCVRYMTGHKTTVYALVFSNCGRFLCSAGGGGTILVWDISTSHLLADLRGHTDTVHRMTFSREGSVLATGGIDCCVKIWDFTKLLNEFDLDEMTSNSPTVRVVKDGSQDGLLLSSYPTKSTSVLCLHFTRRNLLLASGSPVC